MKTQKDIEFENLQLMIDKGINELHNSRDYGVVSELKATGKILPYYVGDLANSLLTYSDLIMSGKAKIKALPAKMLQVLDPLVVSYYTVKAVTDSTGSKKISIVSIARKLATFLETEYKITQLKDEDKDKFVDYIQSRNYSSKRQIKLTNDLLKKYHKTISNTELSFYKLASKAIVLLASTRPVVNNVIAPPLCYITEKKGLETRVEVATWFKEWLFDSITANDGQILPEYYTPLIEEPIKWVGLTGGGFHTQRFKYDLIKTEVDLSVMKSLPLHTLNAVNRLQSTKWSINKEVLDVLLFASNNDKSWGNLPVPYNAKDYITPCPHNDIDNAFLTEEQSEDRKVWRRSSSPHYAEQEASYSKVMQLKRVLIEATRFKDYASIYFSYFLDFRGRIYPKASNLQPQGTDYVKSLLHFTDGKALDTADAVKYFYMQGANSFGHGLDKKTLAEKHQWVLDNSEGIIESANNPHKLTTLWHTSDEDAWLFLAFCFEYRDFLSKPDFKSRLPIAFDGSCNGLQHLSAILLDEVGGASVNLTGQSKKRDIYSDVMDKTKEILSTHGSPFAKELLNFGITRKACKRPVMIVPYAGTLRACRRYIDEQFTKEGGKDIFLDNYVEVLTLYTEVVWQAIGSIILKGKEVMTFLGDLARHKVKETGTNTISWITPNGFEVFQKRVTSNNISIKTPLGNTIKERGYVQNQVRVYTENSSINKHATAIAPNLVHSLDSCHLQNTVNSMSDGVSFAMIHDSFGCHAADAKELSDNTRLEFYNMYKDGEFLNDFVYKQNIEEDLDIPIKGNLDLSLVLNDEFFFS